MLHACAGAARCSCSQVQDRILTKKPPLSVGRWTSQRSSQRAWCCAIPHQLPRQKHSASAMRQCAHARSCSRQPCLRAGCRGDACAAAVLGRRVPPPEAAARKPPGQKRQQAVLAGQGILHSSSLYASTWVPASPQPSAEQTPSLHAHAAAQPHETLAPQTGDRNAPHGAGAGQPGRAPPTRLP